MRVRAFAKINLSLRIVSTRADGYHELRTVFQSLALHDTLVIRRVRGPFRLACDAAGVPVDGRNLVARAAAAAWKAAGRRGAVRGVAIDLVKRIPVAAGLGGGSSDAAAALGALARVWRLDRAKLPAIAASIGADVPYFLEGGTALGLDRGDTLFPLVDRPRAWVMLAVPPFGVSTKDAYAWADEDGVDTLESAVVRRHPAIARLIRSLERAGASQAAMSGSGSAVFGLFGTRAAALRAGETLRVPGVRAIVTHTLTRAAYRRLAAN